MTSTLHKNWTQWSPIMGQWTAAASFKTDTGDSMSMYAALYLGPDSLGTYKKECNPPCDMLANEVCMQTTDTYRTDQNKLECRPITDADTVVGGGDASTYFTIGVQFDVKEFGVDDFYTSGGKSQPKLTQQL